MYWPEKYPTFSYCFQGISYQNVTITNLPAVADPICIPSGSFVVLGFNITDKTWEFYCNPFLVC